MLIANGTNKHAVLAFSTQQAVSLLTYLLELVTEGQLISKAIYGLLTSSKKRTDEFDFFPFLLFIAEEVKFVRSFFGRS